MYGSGPGQERTPRSDRQPQALQDAVLRVVEGPDSGRGVSLGGEEVVVGASPGCDLSLSDGTVSWLHFQIEPTKEGLLLTDLNSTSGIQVDGLRVVSCYLDEEAIISAGQTRLRFSPARWENSRERPSDRFGSLIGSSSAMQKVFTVLRRVAPTETTVLLEGESGTGKELAARSIHQASRRAEGAFVVVDCGAIPGGLVESELFGHERGAFTGADVPRRGAFVAARGGSILLDEIGELPLDVQPKLLRVLECREVKPLGATATRPVDVRVIAATNRDLEYEVEVGRFREDLFYRLAVVRVELPPLRRRREDIPTLARHFAASSATHRAGSLSSDMVALLARHDWPGNVRELRNVVERLLLMPELGVSALFTTPTQYGDDESDLGALLELPYHKARAVWADRFEKAFIAFKLEEAQGVVARAAELGGIPRQTFYRLMRKHGLRTGTTPLPKSPPPEGR